MTDLPLILVTETAGIRTLFLNRPHKRNALNTLLLERLRDELLAAEQNSPVNALILTGSEGGGFCAGADVSEFKSATAGMDELREKRSRLLAEVLNMLPRMRFPVFAALNGAALGAGAALALAADVIVASHEASFGYPETRIGIVPSLMIENLIHHVSRKAAFEIIMAGELIAPKAAQRLGLFNRLVAPEALLTETRKMAAAMGALDSKVIATTKRLFYQAVQSKILTGK